MPEPAPSSPEVSNTTPSPMMNGFVPQQTSTTVNMPSVAGLEPLPIFPQKLTNKNTTAVPAPADVDTLRHPTGLPATHTSALPPSFLNSLVHSAPLLPSFPHTPSSGAPPISKPRPKVVEVQCKARTRVPTPHGPIFLHIYHNNIDSKEHLAIVVDSAQLEDGEADSGSENSGRYIRSRSLDAKWHDAETDMERLIRGAYVGRLSPTQATPSKPPNVPQIDSSSSNQASTSSGGMHNPSSASGLPIPIVRIHSECYTGETIGSMRCDCGEQLDEAIRFISQPQPPQLPPTSSPSASTSSHPQSHHRSPRHLVPGRGAVIYMRQEGRGIGLLEKIKAYNLQDMGADTVAANLMLGHGADERGYDVAAAIMRDLGLDKEIRLLTNNPDKMQAVRKEGIAVSERLPMVPRTWTAATHAALNATALSTAAAAPSTDAGADAQDGRKPGATMIGGGAVHGIDLEKYLRTKVLRMGHLLDLPTPANPQPTHEIVVPLPHESGAAGAIETVESPVVPLRPLT